MSKIHREIIAFVAACRLVDFKKFPTKLTFRGPASHNRITRFSLRLVTILRRMLSTGFIHATSLLIASSDFSHLPAVLQALGAQ
jgi:hypothetical protein